MTLGDNIQYLRKVNDITQEELAERLSVSRQPISKWEMNQAYPEIPKLVEIGNIFHCKVDELLKEDMDKRKDVYSMEVCIHVDSVGYANLFTPLK